MKIRVLCHYETECTITLGIIETNSNEDTESMESLDAEWREFMGTQPDSDDEFIQFLLDKYPTWQLVEDDCQEVTVYG